MRNWTIAVSFALFVVWMQRKGRWSVLARATDGQYAINGTSRSSGSAITVGSPVDTNSPLTSNPTLGSSSSK